MSKYYMYLSCVMLCNCWVANFTFGNLVLFTFKPFICNAVYRFQVSLLENADDSFYKLWHFCTKFNYNLYGSVCNRIQGTLFHLEQTILGGT